MRSGNECQGKEAMNRFRERIAAYERKMDLKTKGERRWFWATFVLLILYMEFVTFAQHTSYGGNVPILDILSALAVISIVAFGVLFFHKIRFTTKYREARMGNKKRMLLFCVAVCSLTFLYCFAWQRAYWPGSFSPDNIVQYGESLTGAYSDWHPVLHTWLFYTLPNKIHADPAIIVSMQMLWFSLSVTYLLSVLCRCGASRLFLFLSWAYILANPNTMHIMLYPWKDSAFSIFSLAVFAQVIQIYASEGAWLRKWHNLLAFAVCCFLAMSMRHNAVLLVIPLLVVLLFFCRKAKAQVLVTLVAVIGGTFLLKGPVFRAVGVKAPGNRTLESVGFPMTVMANVYVNDKDALPLDIRSFLDALGTEEQWAHYRTGSFNALKWSGIKKGLINNKGVPAILDYMARSWACSPKYAWNAFVELTKMVWSVDGGGGWEIGTKLADNSYGIQYHDRAESLQRAFAAYAERASQYGTKYLFNYTGILIAILLFMAVANVGNGNLGRACAILPLMAYDFGTMLLLSGGDFRFFHLNFLLVIPLLFLMGARTDSAARDTQQAENGNAGKEEPPKHRAGGDLGIFLYLIVGGLATLVEWGTFWVLDGAFRMHYLVSTAIAFFFSTFANWLFGRILMFQRKESMRLIREIASIYLASIVGLLLNLVIMYVLVHFLSVQEMASKVLATVLMFAYNYAVRKHVIYKAND